MMKKELFNKVRTYGRLEKEIFDLLTTLPSWSDECKCNNKHYKASIKLVHEGEFDEIMNFCLECGGAL